LTKSDAARASQQPGEGSFDDVDGLSSTAS